MSLHVYHANLGEDLGGRSKVWGFGLVKFEGKTGGLIESPVILELHAESIELF